MGYIIAFICGGTFGFFLCALISSATIQESKEIYIKKELEERYLSKVSGDGNHTPFDDDDN